MALTEAQLIEYRLLLAASISPRGARAELEGEESSDYQRYVWLRGFNGGLEHARMLLEKVQGSDRYLNVPKPGSVPIETSRDIEHQFTSGLPARGDTP